MRLYYMTAAKWGPVILRDRRLKISTIPELNDPFELLAASIGDGAMRQAMKILHEHWSGKLGMICLTEDWHNPVMWAHYAEKHYGFCLGFDVTDRAEVVSKVEYIPGRILDMFQLNRQSLDRDRKFIQRILTTKYKDWSYEREYRVFAELKDREANGLYYFNFGPEFALREVILGSRCQLDMQSVAQDIKDPLQPVEIFKASPAFESFRMVRQANIDPVTIDRTRPPKS